MTVWRVLTAAILVPVVVVIVWWGSPGLVAGLAGLVLLLALVEFFRLGDLMGLRGFRRWTMLCSIGVVYAQWAAGQMEVHPLVSGLELVRNVGRINLTLEAVFLIFILGVAAIALASRRPLAEIFPAVAVSAAALLFVALPFSYLVRLAGVERTGPHLVLFTLALVWAGDTGGFFVGRSIGRLPMALSLSPKKTWEGAAGNLIASLLVAIGFARWMSVEPLPLVVIAALANISGQVGDLLESAYKRGAGVKDSGVLLPGHGGMLDRIDSLIFAAPIVWYYVSWMMWRGQ